MCKYPYLLLLVVAVAVVSVPQAVPAQCIGDDGLYPVPGVCFQPVKAKLPQFPL